MADGCAKYNEVQTFLVVAQRWYSSLPESIVFISFPVNNSFNEFHFVNTSHCFSPDNTVIGFFLS